MSTEQNSLLKHCQDAYQYMAALNSRGKKGDSPSSEELLGQLNSVVEELCVASEELMQQTEELSTTRDKLAVQQRHYQDLFDLAPDGYLVTRQDGIIAESNLAAARLLKTTCKQLRGKPLASFIAPSQQNLFGQQLTTVLGSKQIGSYSWEMQLKPRTGEPVYTLLTSCAIKDDTGRVSEVRWFLHDIRLHKQLEKERELLLARLVNVHEEERARIARELHDNTAQHLTALIVGLQSLKQSNQNKSIPTREFDQLQRISEEMVTAVHQIAVDLRPPSLDDLGLPAALFNYGRGWSKRTGIQLPIHISGFDGLDTLPSDIRIAIYRIVQESLTNVTKHSKARGASLIIERRHDHVLVIVEDDGVGFDPMHPSADSAVSLGLIGMRERAALVGGTLEIESKLDAGTTVFLRIPLPKISRGRMMSSLAVFLADDHAVVREGLKKLVSETPGMSVVGEAGDGETACHDASQLKPDVTVMDISMPGLNGIEATRQLKLLCPSTKVLILTIHVEVDYLREVMQAGASGLVLKQAAGDELIRAIHLVASGGTYLDPQLAAELMASPKDSGSRSPWGVELSTREEAVVRLIAEGHSNKEIARQLHVSIKSVETYKSRSMAKLGFQGRTDFVRFALQKGWLKRGSGADNVWYDPKFI